MTDMGLSDYFFSLSHLTFVVVFLNKMLTKRLNLCQNNIYVTVLT